MNKIEFVDIEFKNFLSYGKIPQKITFEPGINLILGMDDERNRSNGSGKSSVMEAISFALFGRLNRSVKKENITNWKNRKGCEVKLRFIKDNKTYTLIRGIKPDKMEIYCDGALIPPLSDVRLYQKQFENEIIEMDFNTFVSIIHTNLNTLTPILKMDTPKKRQFLERMFGLEVYSKINEKSNEKIREAENKIHQLNIEIDFDNKKLAEYMSLIAEAKKSLQNFTSSRDEYRRISTEIGNITTTDADITFLNDSMEKTRLLLQSRENQRGILNASWVACKAEYEKLVAKKKEEDEKVAKSFKYDEMSSWYHNFILENGEIDELLRHYDVLREDDAQIVKDLSDVMYQKGVSEGKIQNYQILVSNIEQRRRVLKGKDVCPTCGSVVDQDKICAVDEVEGYKIKVDEEYLLILDYKKKILEYNDKRAENHKGRSEIEALESQYDHILGEMAKYEDYKDFKATVTQTDIDNLKEHIDGVKKEIDELARCITDDERIITLYKGKIDDITKELNHKKELETQLRILEERIKQEDKSHQELQDKIGTAETQAKELEDKKKANISQTAKLLDVIDYLEQIKLICKDDKVKQFAISSIMPFLTKQVNHYLAEAGCGFFLKLSGWLEEEICGPGIVNCSYGNLSGGESRSIDLALQLAFLDIVRLQATLFPDIIVFDEILDSSIDSAGLSQLLRIIRTKQKEDNSKIYIITHRTEISDIEIDKIYTIKKKEGFSQIETT